MNLGFVSCLWFRWVKGSLHDLVCFECCCDDLSETVVEWVREWDMAYDALLKESERTNLKGSVELLIEKIGGFTPLVRSITWSGTTKSLGLISSLRLPTALNAIMLRTPIFRNAAIFARELTSCGANSCFRPCRLRNATVRGFCPGLGWDNIVIGLDGAPQGVCSDEWVSGSCATGSNAARLSRPVPPIIAIFTDPGKKESAQVSQVHSHLTLKRFWQCCHLCLMY